MAKVLLENVTKRYGNVEAVKDLNIEVKDKEFLVLVGPSGCGKSTALRMIAGLEEISSGFLYIGNTIVNDVPPKDRDIAMVFQSYALYPHMTVFDNIAFGLRLRKNIPGIDFPEPASNTPAVSGTDHATPANGNGNGTGATTTAAPTVAATATDPVDRRRTREAAIRKRVEAVADAVGLRPYLSRKPSQLSGGQRQRVALGRAIVREPQVFLLDEPLSNLDAKMRVSTRAELQKLHRRLGVTTIYVTHDQVEAMTMGDRIAVMKDGVLQQLDTPQRIYKHPANVFVAGFIGSPAMNLMTVSVEKTEAGLYLAGEGFQLRVPEPHARRLADRSGTQILLGIRPEHIGDARFKRDADPDTVVTAHVDVVEPLGGDVNLYATIGENVPIVAHLDDRTVVRPGNSLKLAFDVTAMNAFDLTTQASLL